MAASTDFWNVASEVQSELHDLAALGDEMYTDLEAQDDPGQIADALQEIKKRLDKLSAQVGPNIVPLRKVAKAMAGIPGVKL